MNTNDAIIKRILAICEEKKSNICDICLKAGMSPSNIYDLMHKRTKYSKIITIKRFCEGAEMTLGQFFSTSYFDELDAELD